MSDFATRDGNLQTGTQFVRRVRGQSTKSIGTSDCVTRRLDRISAGLHSFKFIVKEIIDVPREGCIRFDTNTETANIPGSTRAQRLAHPHGEATLEDVLCRGRHSFHIGIWVAVSFLLHPLLHSNVILSQRSIRVRSSETVGECYRFVEGDTHYLLYWYKKILL